MNSQFERVEDWPGSHSETVRCLLKIPGVKFFLSERLSQDPLENFFGCQRQRGRTGENPNAHQFCKNTQALRVINSVCGNITKGNCRGTKQHVDMQDNKPLSKRRRKRNFSSINDGKATDVENINGLMYDQTIASSSETTILSSSLAPSFTSVVSDPAEVTISHSTKSTAVDSIITPSMKPSILSSVDTVVTLSIPSVVSSSGICSESTIIQNTILSSVVTSSISSVVSSSAIHSDGTLVQNTALSSRDTDVTLSIPSVDSSSDLCSKSTSVQNTILSSFDTVVTSSILSTVLSSGKAAISASTDPAILSSETSLSAVLQNSQSSATCTTAELDSQVLLSSWDSNGFKEQYIREALGPGKADDIVSKGYGIILRRQGLWTLKNCEWLNDQVSFSIVIYSFIVLKCFNFSGD